MSITEAAPELLEALKDCISAMPIAAESEAEHKARWKAIAIIAKIEDGFCRRLMEEREELKKAEVVDKPDERAARVKDQVESWPDWKKEVTLTKYSARIKEGGE